MSDKPSPERTSETEVSHAGTTATNALPGEVPLGKRPASGSEADEQRRKRPTMDFDHSFRSQLIGFLYYLREDKNRSLNSGTPIISEFGLKFPLEGRENTLVECHDLFFDALCGLGSSDRTEFTIPACVGIPGLGKSRMLHEWKRALPDSWTSFSTLELLITYNNGAGPLDLEINLCAPAATFAWRLLHRYFISGNGPSLEEFFDQARQRFPEHISSLTIRNALTVITSEHRKANHLESDKILIVFIGLDEFQIVNSLKPPPSSEHSSLRCVTDAIGGVMCEAPNNRNNRVLSMLAGTERLALEDVFRAAGITSSAHPISRLPLPFLDVTQAEESIRRHSPQVAEFLKQEPVRRWLVYAANVPRFFEKFFKNLAGLAKSRDLIPSCVPHETAWLRTRDTFITPRFAALGVEQSFHILAVAIAQEPVKPVEIAFGTVSWADLEKGGICQISPEGITIPLALLLYCANSSKLATPGRAKKPATDELIDAANALVTKAHAFNVLEPWALWELFGAATWALKINAFVHLGRTKVTLTELLRGAEFGKKNDCAATTVALRAVSVVRMLEKCSPDLPDEISDIENVRRKYSWKSGNYVCINGASGMGIDNFLYFPASDAEPETTDVIILDQRKRSGQKLIPSFLKDVYDKSFSAAPRVDGAKIFVGLFNSLPTLPRDPQIPDNLFVVCRSNLSKFYGSLATHPAATASISLNSPVTTQSVVLLYLNKDWPEKTQKEVAKAIEAARAEKFLEDSEDLLRRLRERLPDVQIDKKLFDDWDCIHF